MIKCKRLDMMIMDIKSEDDIDTCDIPGDQDVCVVDGGAGDVRDAGHVLSVPVMQKHKIIII